MKPTVYLETTIISYLAARPTRDLIAFARQQITHEWWDVSSLRFDLCTSVVVRDEALRGDPQAAARRIEYLRRARLLISPPEAEPLAVALVKDGAIPAVAATDAAHIAVAAAAGIEYLLTWNCTHINNAQRIRLIQSVCERHGFECPMICTPEELS